MTIFLRLLLLLIIANTAQAHQQKAGITTVLFNERSGQIEIAHRFYLHDAEHAVGHLFGGGADIYRDAKTQQHFVNYLQQKFQLSLDGQTAAPLKLLGHELEGKFIWVYQELPLPKQMPEQIALRQLALHEQWPDQLNTVNVEAMAPSGKRRSGDQKALSLSFVRGDDWQVLSLAKLQP
ncbi:MAG: hypothetical protein OIF38_15970 [Cellvibrionaceae bacterium]|nr:hypothetical protein [Cellvibrionaceae bacterium]